MDGYIYEVEWVSQLLAIQNCNFYSTPTLLSPPPLFPPLLPPPPPPLSPPSTTTTVLPSFPYRIVLPFWTTIARRC